MKHISTDDWGILGDDRIRRWPGTWGGKRSIRVDWHSWVGVSPGARHIDVDVKEEDNQWWCEVENAWVTIYRDSAATGYDLRAKVYTESEAKEVSEFFVELIKRNSKDTEYRVDKMY